MRDTFGESAAERMARRRDEREAFERELLEAAARRAQAQEQFAESLRQLDEVRQLREQSAALASLSFESAAALSIAKLSDRAANALANDEMAEHDLLQEAIELLHEAMRTAERARASRSWGG